MSQGLNYQVNKCQNHNYEIKYICLNQDCKQRRGICQDCIDLDQYHQNHKTDIVDLTALKVKSQQLIQKLNWFYNTLEEAFNSVLEMKIFCQNFNKDDIFFQNIEQKVKKIIDLQNFCLNLSVKEELFKNILEQGRECQEINSQLKNQNSSVNQIQSSSLVNQIQSSSLVDQYEYLQINFESLLQNNMVQVDQQNNTLGCSQFHGFFYLALIQIPKEKQVQIQILLLEVGSIKLGFGDFRKFQQSNQWPQLQKDEDHGCYLIDEYGYLYQHGKEQKVYSTPSINMCKNDKIVIKISYKDNKIIWKQNQNVRIETEFDNSLNLCPLFFLSGSKIQIQNN